MMVKVIEEIPDDALCISCNKKFEKGDNVEYELDRPWFADDDTEIQYRHKKC